MQGIPFPGSGAGRVPNLRLAIRVMLISTFTKAPRGLECLIAWTDLYKTVQSSCPRATLAPGVEPGELSHRGRGIRPPSFRAPTTLELIEARCTLLSSQPTRALGFWGAPRREGGNVTA